MIRTMMAILLGVAMGATMVGCGDESVEDAEMKARRPLAGEKRSPPGMDAGTSASTDTAAPPNEKPPEN